MNDTVQLITAQERNALQNREFLLQTARDCTAFGSDLDFDRSSWDVTRYCPKNAGKGNRKSVLYFTDHQQQDGTVGTDLPEPFAAVLKAIVRLKKEGNPKLGYDPLMRIINATRDLVPTLADRGFDPCRLRPEDLNEAARAIGERAQSTTAYRLGNALEEFIETLVRHRVLIHSFHWKNPFKRVANTARVGARATENQAKMPDEETLDELARLSHLVTEDRDLMQMAVVKLLHCAPWRIGEVVVLGADAWIVKAAGHADWIAFDAQSEADAAAAGEQPGQADERHYGTRYFREKQQVWDQKWYPTVMAPVAETAFNTALSISAGPRELARWYEEHPGRAYLPGPDGGPSQQFTAADVCEMFNLSSPSNALAWLKKRGVPIDDAQIPHSVARRDLEEALLHEWSKLDYLTKDGRNMKVSDHLFLTFSNFYNDRNLNPLILSVTKAHQVATFLSTHGEEDTGRSLSIFDRFGSKKADGTPMSINSHDFRHYLNTLAQLGEMSQVLIARWSGRKEISQNAEYDHLSGTMLAEKARGLLSEGRVHGLLADVYKQINDPIDRDTFREAVFETAHVTEIGLCDASFMTGPCPELGACATCEHCNVKKGDDAAAARVQRDYDDTEWLLSKVREAEGREVQGASNYVDAHTKRRDALGRILAIHANPDIPDGTWVRPNAESYDHYQGPALSTADAE